MMTPTTMTQCFLCTAPGTQLFLDLGRQPLANKYPTRAQMQREDFFPLRMYFCPLCKNVELGATVSRARMFEDYYYLSSVNPMLVRHFEELAHKLKSARFVVDIGSNDGILLKPLKDRNVQALGVDPSVNVSKIANDAGLTTLTAFFDGEVVRRIVRKYGRPDVVVASSIFTHLENPHECLKNVRELLSEDGVFIVEVEYIGNILSKIHFERFYLDRIFYYSLTSLKSLFEKHGMYVSHVELIEPHGGSLRVYAKVGIGKSSKRVSGLLKTEAEELSSKKLQAFREAVDRNVVALKQKLQSYKKRGLSVAGYGAPARVSTITNYGNIGPTLIKFIVDDSPLKQGRFSPGKHIPIVPNGYLTEHRPDVLVVFAYEYFNDIKKKLSGKYRYLIPIPPKEVV
jgi:methylation protein EvaC